MEKKRNELNTFRRKRQKIKTMKIDEQKAQPNGFAIVWAMHKYEMQ